MDKVYVCYFLEYDTTTCQSARSDYMAQLEAIESESNWMPMDDSLVRIDKSELDGSGRYYPK